MEREREILEGGQINKLVVAEVVFKVIWNSKRLHNINMGAAGLFQSNKTTPPELNIILSLPLNKLV